MIMSLSNVSKASEIIFLNDNLKTTQSGALRINGGFCCFEAKIGLKNDSKSISFRYLSNLLVEYADELNESYYEDFSASERKNAVELFEKAYLVQVVGCHFFSCFQHSLILPELDGVALNGHFQTISPSLLSELNLKKSDCYGILNCEDFDKTGYCLKKEKLFELAEENLS